MGISKTYKGTAVSEGYGIGNAVVIKEAKLDYSGVAFPARVTSAKGWMMPWRVTLRKRSR